MGRQTRLLGLAWDAWRARAGGPSAIAERRDRRLRETLARARQIPLYRSHWAGLSGRADLSELPPMTKPLWIERFDESVDDPEITSGALWDHMQSSRRIGEPWLGRYSVCRTSGVSGRKGLFVHDQAAMDVYWVLWLTRGWLSWLGPWGLARFLARGGRIANLIATNGHYASAAVVRRRSPLGQLFDSRSATLSIRKPSGRIARALDYWRPTALVGYPTALEQLAREQESASRALDLMLAVSVSEGLESSARARIQTAFGCPLRDSYAASEFLALAFECAEGWLHVNEDWVVIEPVDEERRPVEPGATSDTVLVTNLVNRVQPVVRYDIEDRVTLRPDPCPCGSPFAAVRVEGRRNEVLHFEALDGRRIAITPFALITLTSVIPGRDDDLQFVQTSPRELSVRFATLPGADPDRTWAVIERLLREHLDSVGLAHVEVVRSRVPPSPDPHSGKKRKSWSEIPVAAP
jgi:phenylacetate-CoA ligase